MATPKELNLELLKLSRELGIACNKLESAGCEHAIKENAYRKAKATAYLFSEGKTIDAKKAEVDLKCENERLAAHIAESAKIASLERVRAIRAQLSALQSVAASTRAELENLHTPEPDDRHSDDVELEDAPF